MNMRMENAAKLAGAAMAAGGAAMLGAAMIKSNASLKKKAKKTAGKAIDAVDSLLTNVQRYMK